ncbi:hypothetical protein [Agarilytica rhodophyticola]|uniref:hypothetical protein n=1 Tax=Agarilytica rhodophyticola TaxID=1737490 RepID=UPI000B344705|nr:hypothetical protein [Agarilytica rhodophyticola]
MDRYEKIGYSFLAVIALIYLIVMLTASIIAFPHGLIGFFLIIGIGTLFIKVVKERLENKEDDFYSKGVKK